MEKVSVIIPTMRGREDKLRRLILSIPHQYEIIVVDDEDLLLAAKRNKGAKKASGEYLLFIDDDNVLEPGAIEEAMKLARVPMVGVVGLMAFYDDQNHVIADGGSIRNYQTGFTSGVNTNARRYSMTTVPYEVDEVANAFIMHRETFYDLYGFDEKRFPIELDEADFCKRVKALGMKIMMCPKALCATNRQTYSHIPNFRRPLSAYFMGRNRVLYQRKHNNDLRFIGYLLFFMPVFVLFYVAALVYKKNPVMIVHFLQGVFDGIFGRLENKYQTR